MSISKVLLEHSHDHLFRGTVMSALKVELSSYEKLQGPQNIYYLALDRKSCPAPGSRKASPP